MSAERNDVLWDKYRERGQNDLGFKVFSAKKIFLKILRTPKKLVSNTTQSLHEACSKFWRFSDYTRFECCIVFVKKKSRSRRPTNSSLFATFIKLTKNFIPSNT